MIPGFSVKSPSGEFFSGIDSSQLFIRSINTAPKDQRPTHGLWPDVYAVVVANLAQLRLGAR